MNLAMMYRTIASQFFFKLYTLEAINLMITVYLSIQLKKELSLLYTNKIFSHTRAMCSYKALR